MSELLINVGSDAASDSWGFVGVVRVGEIEAYRTLEAFATPREATLAAQRLMSGVLGELLAGREWRGVRDDKGAPPTREDFNLSAMNQFRPKPE
jgi:hypothetical protein